MQDRLSELTGAEDLPRVEEEEVGDKEKADDDDAVIGEAEEFMKEFFEEVGQVKQGMAHIRKNIRAIEETYGQSLVAVGLEQGSKSSQELENLIDETNLAATDVRNRLKEMDQENKKMESKEKGSAQYRIKTNMHGTLTRKFLDLMAEYQEVQTKFRNKFRERVERQYRIVKPDATQEEIDEALESGNTQVFERELLNKRHEEAKNALNYIENRHRDILRLEQSIKELHQLFVEMAILYALLSFMLVASSVLARDLCRENEVFRQCANPCPQSCQDRNPSCIFQRCRSGCECDRGMIRDTVSGRCVLPEECPIKQTQCGENEVFSSCPTPCAPSCNEPNRICPPSAPCASNSGACECKPGFVRREQGGPCVRPEQCASNTCGPNQILKKCPNICPATCEFVNPPECPYPECEKRFGCECAPGYILSAIDGACVKNDTCDFKCGANEAVYDCMDPCPRTCAEPAPAVCSVERCTRGCGCKHGFVREMPDGSGRCVPLDSCVRQEIRF